jgi:hypothetical protein
VEQGGQGSVTTAIQAIRQNCIDCSGGNRAEVARCTVTKCPLFPFRLGKNPNKRPRIMTDEQRELLSQRGKALAARSKSKRLETQQEMEANGP